jgi:hypothetical protein
MKISPGFAAVEGRLFRSVDKNLQVLFKGTGGREVNETIVAAVKAADEAGDNAGGFSQAKIDTAVCFDVEIRIADDELKRGVVRAAREKFLRSRRVPNN